MVEDKAKAEDKRMIAAACKAYGVDEKYLFASKVYPDGEVVLVTSGGAKVRWRKGDEAEPLDPVRVDGVIRKKMKPVTGAKKRKAGKAEDQKISKDKKE